MSKFIEKLKSQTKISPSPLGFGKALAQEKPKMSVVVLLTGHENDKVGERVTGADAAFVSSDSTGSLTETFSRLNEINPDLLCGVYLKNNNSERTDLTNVTADFIVFSAKTPLSDIPDKSGRVLEIEDTVTDTQLRAIDELPIDAVYFAVKPEVLDWQYLITIQRLDNLLTKPLLVAVPLDTTTEELQILWNVGADGIVVEAAKSGKLKMLRGEIDKTVFPLPRKPKKADVRIPFISPSTADESDEEEDE